jgi:uncharacterized protein (DUF433 family)
MQRVGRMDRRGCSGVIRLNQQDRDMDRAEIYHTHPGILGGKPVFTGTRVPVDTLIDHLRAGTTLEEFLDDFPSVNREQAEAFLALALNDALELTPHDSESGV